MNTKCIIFQLRNDKNKFDEITNDDASFLLDHQTAVDHRNNNLLIKMSVLFTLYLITRQPPFGHHHVMLIL